MTRHLLAISDLSPITLKTLIARGKSFAAQQPSMEDRQLLHGETMAQLFYEPSTRTRCSFEIAARRLGADVLNLEMGSSSETKGETIRDTARTLAAMGVKLFVIRHKEPTVVSNMAEALPSDCHLLNAGSGSRQHPTQALLDMLTLDRAAYDFSQLDIAIVGDLRHSRVAASAIEALQKLKTHSIRLGGPSGFLPDKVPTGVSQHDNLADSIRGADVVMTLRIQRERIISEQLGELSDYHADWGLSEARLKELAPNARIMHPGPMNRGVEIDDAVADGPRSLVLDQVENGVAARMAALEWLHIGDRQA